MPHNHPLLVWDLETSGIYVLLLWRSHVMHPESFVDAKTWSPHLQVGLIGAIANIGCFKD